MDLVTFLLDRFGEDEAEINRHPIDDGEPLDESLEPQGLRAEVGADWPYAKWLRIGKARALREVEAKRRILDEHQPHRGYDERITFCIACGGNPSHGSEWPCDTIRSVVAIYSEHPDYDLAWKP